MPGGPAGFFLQIPYGACRGLLEICSMDPMTAAERSKQMSLVRSKDTKPELRVKAILDSFGMPYKSHVRDLPGCPDFVFPNLKKVVFVHGCFWHDHTNCKNARIPKSRVKFWRDKIGGNRRRDLKNLRRLNRLGWSYKVIWECQAGKSHDIEGRLRNYLLGH